MQNQAKPYTPNQYIKIQTYLHLAFLSAMLAFAAITSVIIGTWQLLWNFSDDPFFFIVPLTAILGLILSRYLFQKQLDSIKKLHVLKEKLDSYQTATLIKYACIEGPALLSLVVFLNTENAFFLIIALFMIMYFYVQRPTREIIEGNLNLNSEMRNQFNKTDQIIE